MEQKAGTMGIAMSSQDPAILAAIFAKSTCDCNPWTGSAEQSNILHAAIKSN